MKLPTPERYERLLRILCLVLAGVLLVRVGWIAMHHNPLAHLKMPAVPTLAATAQASGGKATNTTPNFDGTKKSTNSLSVGKPVQGTNSTASPRATTGATNAATASAQSNTNAPSEAPIATAVTKPVPGTNAVRRTNAIAAEEPRKGVTNSIVRAAKTGTNGVADASSEGKPAATGSPPATASAMVNPSQRPGMPGKPRDLSPESQARVDRITDSEILGPVMRPLPIALLGIAGNIAFVRAPNGQTGLVKENEDFGGLKLLRIGINRVLVEQEGQKKELTMFSGFGGESLLPKESKPPP